MNDPDPLADLRDIHLPDSIPWWPPAVGWWVLLALGLGLCVVGWWLIRRRRRSARRAALKELKVLRHAYREGERALAPQLSSLLRRYALTLFTRERVAGLTGQAWLEFLDRTARMRQFSRGPGNALVSAPYSGQATGDTDELLALAEQWITRARPGTGRDA